MDWMKHCVDNTNDLEIHSSKEKKIELLKTS